MKTRKDMKERIAKRIDEYAIELIQNGMSKEEALNKAIEHYSPEPQHSPTPFGLEAGRCITKDGKPFVTVQKAADTSPVDADEFTRKIVRAVNSHEEMLEALELVLPELERYHYLKHATGNANGIDIVSPIISKVKQAIANAEGR